MKRRRLLAVESPFPGANVMLRFLEPPGSCQQTLRDQVYAGTYGKPFVVDNGARRFLHFDFGAIQSVMEMSHPGRLTLAYTRKMMAFLLFNPAPKRILLLGLGGGSLAKFCYVHLPAATVTAVEVNRDVIALRDEFGVPADDDRFRVINADAAAHVSRTAQSQDVILADACDRTGTATELGSVEFYRNARRRLSAGGVFVANICGGKDSAATHLGNIREAFDDQLFTLQVRAGGNMIVFGFKDRRPRTNWQRLEAEAKELKRRFQLDFPTYVRRMALESKMGEGCAGRRRRLAGRG